jgi:hypothetical protein
MKFPFHSIHAEPGILSHGCTTLHCSLHYVLSDLQTIHIDVVVWCCRRCRSRLSCRQPALWVLVEERPRWYDDEEGERGTGKADIERQADILCEVANEEGDDLSLSVSRQKPGAPCVGRTPAAPKRTVVSISASRWPSKSYACQLL